MQNRPLPLRNFQLLAPAHAAFLMPHPRSPWGRLGSSTWKPPPTGPPSQQQLCKPTHFGSFLLALILPFPNTKILAFPESGLGSRPDSYPTLLDQPPWGLCSFISWSICLRLTLLPPSIVPGIKDPGRFPLGLRGAALLPVASSISNPFTVLRIGRNFTMHAHRTTLVVFSFLQFDSIFNV